MRRIAQTVLFVLVASSVVAQEQERVNQPTFRSGIELLQLDVSVLDELRRPVRGLTADDFTVLENGVPRPIRAFTAVNLPSRAATETAVWAKNSVPDIATNRIAQQEGRLVIILLDRSIPYMGGTLDAQKVALAAVDQLGPNDLAAVISTSGAYTPQNFTSDHSRLVKAINQRDWSTESGAVPWSLDGGDDPRCFCGLCVLETLTNASEAVRDTPRRRKVLLFIGRGIVINLAPLGPTASPGCEHSVRTAREKLFASLSLSNLTVHSIDSRGLFSVGDHTQASVSGAGFDRAVNSGPEARMQALQAARIDVLRTQDSLAVLPDLTGGRRVVNTNSLAEKVADIFHESDAYYVIGIERDASAKPETRRSLEIKVARPGVRAYSQREIVEPRAALANRPQTIDSPTDGVLSALLPRAAKPLRLAAAAFAKPNGDEARVNITIDAGAFLRQGAATTLNVTVNAFDPTGVSRGSAKQSSTLVGLPDDVGAGSVVNVQSHLDLPPGDYEIRALVVDSGTEATASVYSQVLIPKFSTERLSLSDIVVLADGAIAPTTERMFGRAAQVHATGQIYQGMARTDTVRRVTTRVRVLDARGAVATDQSLAFGAGDFQARWAGYRIRLPVDRLAPGDYLAEIAATDGETTATRKLRFAVK